MAHEEGVALVFSDMDDTFLARDKSLPRNNLLALDLLARYGVGFVPCTGRAITGVPERLAGHPATRYLVGSNGAVVADARTGEVVRRRTMPVSLVEEIYSCVRHLDVTFDVFVDGHVLAERARYDAMGAYGIDEANLAAIRSIREPRDRTIPELVAGLDGVEKVTLYWAGPAERDEARGALDAFDGISVTTSHPRNWEFMACGVSKGDALEWVCGREGVGARRAVAFGDSANDASMLAAAGIGVAMANATDAARAASDCVCGDCDAAGVGEYLSALLSRR